MMQAGYVPMAMLVLGDLKEARRQREMVVVLL